MELLFTNGFLSRRWQCLILFFTPMCDEFVLSALVGSIHTLNRKPQEDLPELGCRLY